MSKERQFLDALRDLFIGAKVEGESGYINLMRIKARYFEQGVFPRLMEDIETALQPFPEFREELFDRLYTFFHRYFSESGSIYFRYTPLHERVYEQVYTDDRDVMLFWKTHMLYYVKTDRLFQSMDVEVEGQTFHFDVATLEHKRANEKRSLVYAFVEKRADGALVFSVAYSEKGRITPLSDIRRALRQVGVQASEETLERAFRLFERQSEVDYFINKNARAFLREQLDLWMYQYVFQGETTWTEKRIRQLQALKEIAYRIIDFIAQFEDELVRIWNKPKFVLNSHYVITLERIAARDVGLLRRLLAHRRDAEGAEREAEGSGIVAQLREWRELGMVDEAFSAEDVWQRDLLGEHLHPRYQYLPLDTRYFPELETDILALYDHLDQELDGWLIHSENYQALNTLLPKFRERVKCVYIDPPYNTGNDEFIYRDQFRHSSWLTMMENRLRLAREWLREDGGIFASIDYNEEAQLQLLCEIMFGAEQRRNTVISSRVKKSIMEHEKVRALNWGHGYLLFFARSDKTLIVPPLVNDRGKSKKDRWHAFDAPGVRPTMEYELFGQKPPSGRHWMYSESVAQEMIGEGRLRCTASGKVEYKVPESEGTILDTNWTDVVESDSKWGFMTEKNVRFIERTLKMIAEQVDFVLDFFAGSGTTAHAVINLNREDGGRRKYILVEMGDYFDTVLLPRVKKVVFSDKWKDGRAQEGRGISHFVKYYDLEQYEDALRRARYEPAEPLFIQADPYGQYVFLRDTKMLDNAQTGARVVELDLAKEEIRVEVGRLYAGVDLAETLSCVTGKWIRRLSREVVEFEDGERVSLTNPPWELLKPLIWW